MFKSNKIKLDCYTYDKKIMDMQPLQTVKNNPHWWSKLKTMYKVFNPKTGIDVPTPTIKACPGIVDYIRRPILIKLWSDIIFRVYPDGRVHLSEPLHGAKQGIAHIHDEEQHGNHIYKDRTVVKLIAPWHIVADKPIDFICADPHYSTEELRKNNIIVSPGVLSFYHQHTVNVFLTFQRKEEVYEVTLKYDTPLMALFPMTEKKIDIEMHHCKSRSEWEDISDIFPPTFLGRYHTRKRATRN